ncbi:MAG: hypothetical protein M3515_07530, partial [Actinomycetota bacterium]|nr:hypothetical protein [Actinomycetota bacterium]
MSLETPIETGEVELVRGELRAAITLDPFALSIHRGGRPLLTELTLWAAEGESEDRFVQTTEGVIASERLEEPEAIATVDVVERDGDGALALSGTLDGGRAFELRAALERDRLVLAFETGGGPLRHGARWTKGDDERFVGLGARHGEDLDQSERRVRLGADRRYT